MQVDNFMRMVSDLGLVATICGDGYSIDLPNETQGRYSAYVSNQGVESSSNYEMKTFLIRNKKTLENIC